MLIFELKCKYLPTVENLEFCFQKGGNEEKRGGGGVDACYKLQFTHLSRKLKWAFLIAFRPYVCLSVNFSSSSPLGQFNQTWHKAFLGVWKVPLGPRLLSREDNNEMAEIHWRNLKIFSKADAPISIKLMIFMTVLYKYVFWLELCLRCPWAFRFLIYFCFAYFSLF